MNRNFQSLAIVTVLLLVPFVARAGSLDDNVIALFPKHVTQFAYLDLETARQLPWFAQFKQQTLPPTVITLEQYFSLADMKPNTRIKQVAWATVSAGDGFAGQANEIRPGGGIVGILLGDFDPDSVQVALDARNAPKIELSGYTLYSCGIGPECGNMYFFFLDSNTAVFGQLPAIEQLLQVKDGAAEDLLANQEISSLIEQVNGDDVFWDVFDSIGARQPIQELAPEASKFAQSTKFLSSVKSLTISVRSSTDTELDVQIACASPNGSLILSQMLQAGLLVRQYQARESKPVLAQTLDQAKIAVNGNFAAISIEISNDQVIGLIEEDAFAVGN